MRAALSFADVKTGAVGAGAGGLDTVLLSGCLVDASFDVGCSSAALVTGRVFGTASDSGDVFVVKFSFRVRADLKVTAACLGLVIVVLLGSAGT